MWKWLCPHETFYLCLPIDMSAVPLDTEGLLFCFKSTLHHCIEDCISLDLGLSNVWIKIFAPLFLVSSKLFPSEMFPLKKNVWFFRLRKCLHVHDVLGRVLPAVYFWTECRDVFANIRVHTSNTWASVSELQSRDRTQWHFPLVKSLLFVLVGCLAERQ
jgi:hypothetical protein